ncbi:MAG: alpha/beta hydrolase [Reyranellales bacterium]
MVDILFATNRPQIGGDPLAPFGSGTVAAGGALFCGVATVQGIDPNAPSAGTIANIDKLVQGNFGPQHLEPILASTNDVLIFVHGAANSFTDAITRAAYNQTWLAASGLPNSTFDVIAFTWPATPYHFANILGDLEDYKQDQRMATASAAQFSDFLNQMAALRSEMSQLGRRRMSLLCHSMGNFMLGGALQAVLQGKDFDAPIFDEVILAAADEPATTFNTPNQRLAGLAQVGSEITVYYNNDDILMRLSHIANGGVHRLGYDGPANKPDTELFPPSVYEFVDCTGVNDFLNSPLALDRSHQYYRQSQRVRTDIVQTLAGFAPARPKFDPIENVYTLFPERLHAPDRSA